MIASLFLALTILFTGLGIRLIATSPHQLLRPSLFIWFGYLFIYSWPVCLQIAGVWQGDELPEPFLVVLTLFMILGYFVIVASYQQAPRLLLARMKLGLQYPLTKREHNSIAVGLLILTLGILTIYFTVVPPSATGLYAVIFDPENASLAREKSLKLLDSQSLKYAMAFLLAGFAPFLFVFAGLRLVDSLAKPRGTEAVKALLLCLLALATLLLAGERSRTFFATLALIFALMLRRWDMKFSAKLLLLVPIALIPPVLLTILREGRDVGTDFIDAFVTFFLWRIGSGPLEVAIWHVDYVETVGQVGISAIPKIAAMLGEPVINLPNIIGLKYADSPGETISAGTGFLFSYYAMFGYFTLIPSVAALVIVDGLLLIALKLNPKLLLPVVACLAQPCMGFTNADFSTIWLSHGIVPLFGLAFLLGRLVDPPGKAPRSVGGDFSHQDSGAFAARPSGITPR